MADINFNICGQCPACESKKIQMVLLRQYNKWRCKLCDGMFDENDILVNNEDIQICPLCRKAHLEMVEHQEIECYCKDCKKTFGRRVIIV